MLAAGLLIVLALAWGPARAQSAEGAASAPRSRYHLSEGGEVRVDLFVFWSTGCPHCRRAVRFIREELEDELAWLDAHLLELSEPGNAAMYQDFAEALGVEAAYVPAFFYCGGVFHGYDEDATTGQFLRESLTKCRADIMASLAEDQAGGVEQAKEAPGGQAEMAVPAPPPTPIEVPLIGAFDPAALSLPVMTVALAAMDAFNPCAFCSS